MKKLVFILISLLLMSNISICQNIRDNVNIVITINDKLVVGSISDVKLRLVYEDSIREVKADYVPGNLLLSDFSTDSLSSEGINSIVLDFDYNQFCNDYHEIHNYEVELKKTWMEYSYIVLRVYDFSKKENKKQFDHMKDKEYTYEMDFPGFSINRVRKKDKKNNCN